MTPPVLPLPKGLSGVQAVHADDIGEAYALAAVKRAGGAFNICADDILTPQDLADIVGQGRYVHLPAGLVRAAIAGSHKTNMVAMDEGWIDMALSVPMMDNSRAKTELGWHPTHSAADALRELIAAMIKGEGGDSVPLRPRDRDYSTVPGMRTTVGEGASEETPSGDEDVSLRGDAPQGEFGRGASGISDRITKDLIELYVSDHLTGATAGTERIERMEKDFVDTPVYPQISQVADKIRRERALLQQIIHDLGFKQKPYRQAAAWVGEHVGRLKLNNRVLSRSPMTLAHPGGAHALSRGRQARWMAGAPRQRGGSRPGSEHLRKPRGRCVGAGQSAGRGARVCSRQSFPGRRADVLPGGL